MVGTRMPPSPRTLFYCHYYTTFDPALIQYPVDQTEGIQWAGSEISPCIGAPYTDSISSICTGVLQPTAMFFAKQGYVQDLPGDHKRMEKGIINWFGDRQ